jgi:hypothetical protein
VLGTFYFVHGTGVRQARYDELWATIQERARRNGIDGVDFVGCPWGANVGVTLDRIAATLPPDAKTRAAIDGAPSDTEIEVALWAMLLEDPLLELRLAGEGGPGRTKVVVGAKPPGEAARAALLALQATPPDVRGSGLSVDEVVRAAKLVAAAPELAAAAAAAGTSADEEVVGATARAVVATALARRREDGGEPPAAAVEVAARKVLISTIETAIAPARTRSVGDKIKKRVKAFAVKRASAMARERRGELMTTSLPGVGDIIYYERRGGAIADYVAEGMANLRRPVVAVGHSLGGIMLVDLLTRETPPVADALVTVGSQAPLLYAIDSLQRLRPSETDPQPFVPWLNVYDRSDLLSFCAEATFPGVTGINDHEVESGVPFPEAHSAYWRNDRVYELIRDAWPAS